MRISHALMVGAVLALASGSAYAQESTERYIPIGQSPGISNVVSYIGQIESVDAAARTVTFSGPEGSMTVRVADTTRIWVDRSGSRQSNLVGTFRDLKPGTRAEVKFLDPERRQVAQWVKVEGA